MNLKFYFLLLSTGLFPAALSAQSTIEGIIYDRESKERVGQVMIRNLKTNARNFNNLKGEFKIVAHETDTLVLEKEGYFTDTLLVTDKPIMVISMLKDFTYIDPVRIVRKNTPESLRDKAKEEYKDAYRLADPGSLISTGLSGTPGLSINAIYNLFSKEGKNARRFTEYMNVLYQENVIDSKFTAELVRNLTGLEGTRLSNFMIRYRPSYEFVTSASKIEMANYIKNKYNIFKIMPDLRPLPELPSVDFDITTEK